MLNIIRDLFLILIGAYFIGVEFGAKIGLAVFFVATAVNNFNKYSQ